MLSMRHPHDPELLMALDGELGRRRQAGVDEHLSGCAACQLRLRQLRTSLADATTFYQSVVEPGLPPSPMPRRQLESALHRAADEWNRSWLTRVRGALAASPLYVAAAPALVAVVLVALWISRPHPTAGGPLPGFGAPLPVAALTPGAVSSLTAAELCAGDRPSRVVTAASRQRVLRDYRMEHVSTGSYELDALITPELGGTTVPENLWPQGYTSPVWNARVKDELEQLLPRLVCSNEVGLAQAQRDIARDWIAAYQHYFKTDVPLHAHRGAPASDADDLELTPVRYVARNAAPLVLGVRLPRP